MFSFTQDVIVEEWNIFKYWWRRNISLQTLKQKGPSCRTAIHHTISCFTANMDPLWSLFHVCVIGHNPFLAEEGGGWVPRGRCETHAWGHTFEKWTTGWPWPRSSKPNNVLCYIISWKHTHSVYTLIYWSTWSARATIILWMHLGRVMLLFFVLTMSFKDY